MKGNTVTTAIVIPARNEVPTIARVVEAGRRHCPHVIVIDDASDDGTAAAAEGAGARIIRHPTRLGYGGALRSGLREALELGAHAIVTLDADGAHDPDESPALVAEHLRVGADLTLGTRFHEGAAVWFPTTKRDANRLGRAIFNLVHGSALTDVASGFRVLSRKIASNSLENSSFAAAFELLSRALTTGLKVHEAPTSVRYDASKPFCTGRGELHDFLKFCMECANDPIRQDLIDLLAAIGGAQSCSIAIGKEEFGLHFFSQFDAYMIQRQHPWYCTKEAEGRIALCSQK